VYGGGYRPGPQKRCWCGSGKKEKNCHGKRGAQAVPVVMSAHAPAMSPGIGGGVPTPARAAVAAGLPALRAVSPQPKVEVSPWGVPGEDHKIWVQPIMKGQEIPKGPVNLGGNPGPYRVHMLLARPGYPMTKEREHKFIDQLVGDSYIRIAKPARDRGPHDIEKMLFAVGGKNIKFEFLTNDEGFLGKIIAELNAANVEDAERQAYGEIAPFLSAWSLNMDIPVHVETIQVTDLTTHVNALRTRTPHFEMNWGGAGGALPFFLRSFANMRACIERA
jgi:hypothetical protein